MANTLSGPFSKIVITNGSTPANKTWGDNAQTQAGVALGSFNPDLIGAGFILSGCAASRHNSYAATVLADAPTRYYRMDDTGVDGLAIDQGSASQSLVYSGGETFSVAGLLTGDSDTAVTFAAASSQYAAGTSSGGLPTGTGNATLEAWIKVTGAPGATQVILEVGDVAVANHRLCLQLTSTLTVQLTNGTVTITSAAISTGAPHHLVGTWDGTNVRLYVDGALAAGPTAATMSWSYTGNAMAIATASGATPGNWFSGTVDEAAVYKTALSAGQVTTHYTNGTTATTTVDIASGTAYLVESDGTLTRCAVTSTTQTTSALSSTYNLYLQPDGSWYWSTSNTPAANSLYIATVATNGSGQAITVTDKRTTAPVFLPGASAAGITTRVASWNVSGLAGINTHHLLPQFTVPATGLYRLSGSFWLSQAASCTVTISVSYTPGFSGGSSSTDFLITNGTSAAVAELDGGVTIAGTGAHQLVPWTGYLAAGSTFEVDYKDATTTPNDAIALVLERLT